MKIDKILEDIITPDFLKLVEKWARYKGPRLSVNDADIHVEDKGVFTEVTTMPKLVWDENGKFHVSKTENEDHITLYDVTMITNIAVCSDHFIRVLIAERFPEGDNEYFSKKLPKLFIYSVKRGKAAREFPNFAKLKSDFESKTYKPYNSMLYNFCDIYKLSPFNDKTDRIFNYTGIESDLECLECEQESIEASKDIVTSDWENIYLAHKNYLETGIKPKFKQE
jgi:hypothetical protein